MTANPVPSDCGAYFGALYRVARTVNSSLDVMQALDTIVGSTVEALGVKACSLRLLGPDGKRLMFGAAHGLSPNYRAKGAVDAAHSEVDRMALAADKPIYVADARTDPRFQYPEQARAEGIVSVLICPLRVQDQPIGVMRVYTGEPRTFSEAELELVEAIASLSALAIENGRLYERLDRNYQAAVEFGDRLFD
ncbi:MAG: GAF domain-containing protein [Chloroflexi bacterium]|nr:GAF domain-containing protein [Chloroflexota bacterium]